MAAKETRLRKDTRALFSKKVDDMGGEEVAAIALRCSTSTISGICTGRRGLGLGLALRIERMMRIRMQEWPEPEEVEDITFKRIA